VQLAQPAGVIAREVNGGTAFQAVVNRVMIGQNE
jgi:hypothetical protein